MKNILKEIINSTSFLALDSPKRRLVSLAIGDRYMHPHIARRLLNEIDFLREVLSLLEGEIKNRKGKLSGYLLEAFRDHYLQKSIKILETIQEKESLYIQATSTQ